jgi:hypothetical protein
MATLGVLWIDRAAAYYQELTGRAFYGLAGYYYSSPEWGFVYHPGGRAIRQWTTIVPGYATVAAILLSAVIAIVRHRQNGWRAVVAVGAAHVIAAVGFMFAVIYFDVTITGVFI